MLYIYLFAGGGIGTLLRYAVGRIAVVLWGTSFPLGTLIVNVVGSFIMGVFAGWFARHPVGTEGIRLFLMTGVLGGFTTFSAFSLDTITLWERGMPGAALAYVSISFFVSLTALAAGLFLMRAAL